MDVQGFTVVWPADCHNDSELCCTQNSKRVSAHAAAVEITPAQLQHLLQEAAECVVVAYGDSSGFWRMWRLKQPDHKKNAKCRCSNYRGHIKYRLQDYDDKRCSVAVSDVVCNHLCVSSLTCPATGSQVQAAQQLQLAYQQS